MVGCLLKDLSQQDRFPNKLQASSPVNKVDMADRQPNLPVNMLVNKWLTVVLPVPVVMAVVSRLRMLNGVLLQLRALETALAAIKDNPHNVCWSIKALAHVSFLDLHVF